MSAYTPQRLQKQITLKADGTALSTSETLNSTTPVYCKIPAIRARAYLLQLEVQFSALGHATTNISIGFFRGYSGGKMLRPFAGTGLTAATQTASCALDSSGAKSIADGGGVTFSLDILVPGDEAATSGFDGGVPVYLAILQDHGTASTVSAINLYYSDGQ